ncbi:MAG: hypothetical protein JWN01_991 [Patescibacteria group bacterium]|nr:hypothetical protein [Patescibacteria group bacterium]
MSGKEPTQSDQQFPGQHDGEEVIFLFRQHPLVMRKALILGLLVILVGVLPLDFPQIYSSPAAAAFLTKIALGIPVIVFLAWFYRWVGWYYTMYIVTDRRILAIKQKGFFNRKVDEWQLDDISNVNYHINGFQAVLFGFGDITARTYLGTLEMKTVHKPVEVHEQLVRVLSKYGGGSTQSPN